MPSGAAAEDAHSANSTVAHIIACRVQRLVARGRASRRARLKAHRLLDDSSPGLRVIMKKQEEGGRTWERTSLEKGRSLRNRGGPSRANSFCSVDQDLQFHGETECQCEFQCECESGSECECESETSGEEGKARHAGAGWTRRGGAFTRGRMGSPCLPRRQVAGGARGGVVDQEASRGKHPGSFQGRGGARTRGRMGTKRKGSMLTPSSSCCSNRASSDSGISSRATLPASSTILFKKCDGSSQRVLRHPAAPSLYASPPIHAPTLGKFPLLATARSAGRHAG